MCGKLISTVFFLLAIFVLVNAQLKWRLEDDGQSVAPTRRRDAGLGYEPESNVLVLFGGKDINNKHLDDTWIYSIYSGRWRNATSTDRPPARRSFVYGSVGKRFFIATGEGKPLLNDIWEFNFTSESWKQLPQKTCDTESQIPQPRYGGAGGIHPDSDQLYVSLGFGKVRYFDTFVYNISKKCWKEVTSGASNVYNPSYPHARCLHGGAMTDKNELVIFGGCLGGGGVAGPCPTGDTWMLRKDTRGDMKWTEMEYCPLPRIYTTMAKLPSPSRKAVLYGGVEKSKQVLTTSEIPPNEIAIFDSLSKTWTLKQTQEKNSPDRRASAVMVTVKEGIYMFGGVSMESGGLMNDLWLLEGDADKSPTLDTCNRLFINHIAVHGILMFLGWGVFLQLGAFVAMYCRGSSSTWFRFHFGLQTFGLLLSLAGLVFAVLSVDIFKTHFTQAHSVIGLIVMIVGCLQPLNAVFRPHISKVKTIKRRVWEFFHKNLGRIVLPLATVNITLGMFVGVVPRPIWIAWVVYWAVLAFMCILAELCKMRRVKE
ncbi:uncharacterized protein LOC135468528 [Liolophura sinensis]|uniref:uncharacterized protein LOC135468528 n=1 Tax=Liolophura sinensis TaxID=3198878 RepID=UPI0031595165